MNKNLNLLKINDPFLAVLIELVEVNAELASLERAKPFTSGNYYYNRVHQLNIRAAELVGIVETAKFIKTTIPQDAPAEQYLVSKDAPKVEEFDCMAVAQQVLNNLFGR
jgi:hypothetical protein